MAYAGPYDPAFYARFKDPMFSMWMDDKARRAFFAVNGVQNVFHNAHGWVPVPAMAAGSLHELVEDLLGRSGGGVRDRTKHIVDDAKLAATLDTVGIKSLGRNMSAYVDDTIGVVKVKDLTPGVLSFSDENNGVVTTYKCAIVVKQVFKAAESFFYVDAENWRQVDDPVTMMEAVLAMFPACTELTLRNYQWRDAIQLLWRHPSVGNGDPAYTPYDDVRNAALLHVTRPPMYVYHLDRVPIPADLDNEAVILEDFVDPGAPGGEAP